MNKSQKIILYGAIGVFVALAALIIVLIVQNARHTSAAQTIEQRFDSLQMENNRLELENLTSEFDRLNAEFEQYEGREITLKNDSLVAQYNEAKEKINSLLSELDKERASNRANREKIKQLESEIATLKGIARHYLEEIRRLNEENEGLRAELGSEKERNETLERENASTRRSNAEMSETIQLAKKLNITSLSLQAFNNKGKTEKNITKAKKLGVFFNVSPNNTAAPGKKDFYIRIISPEGSVLGGGVSLTYDGATMPATATRSYEYDNGELKAEIYWTVDTTLTPGDYTVEVFCDGYRLGTGRFTMKK